MWAKSKLEISPWIARVTCARETVPRQEELFLEISPWIARVTCARGSETVPRLQRLGFMSCLVCVVSSVKNKF